MPIVAGFKANGSAVFVHAAFHIVKSKKHVTVVDEDNGVSVAADLDYVVRALHASKLVGFRVPVLLCDAFGAWDVINDNGTLRGLDAASEDEALRAA